jgi:hypothetical protein
VSIKIVSHQCGYKELSLDSGKELMKKKTVSHLQGYEEPYLKRGKDYVGKAVTHPKLMNCV